MFITTYLILSITLISSPLIYEKVNHQFYRHIIHIPLELSLAVLAGIVIYIAGVNTTEKASSIYLKLNSMI